MEFFTIELVSNASAQLFADKTLNSCTNFLPEQLNLDGQWEVAISKLSYTSIYHNVKEGKLIFLDKKLWKSSELYFLEAGLYPSNTDNVEDRNTLIQEDATTDSKSCITVQVSRRTQKQ